MADRGSRPAVVHPGTALPWLVALLGWCAVVAVFHPGYMTYDAAFQWWQARHGQFDSVHPPLMAMLWQATDRVLPGPGGMFLLQQALLWSAYAGIACALPWRGGPRALLVLVLGFWPPLLGVAAHVWKDVWTLAAFAWAVAWLARDLHRPSRASRGLACLAIVVACAFRLNAITGALPLLAWLAWRELQARGMATAPRTVVATAVLSAGVLLASHLPMLDPRVTRIDSVWSVITLWDATGVSLREGRMVIPAELVDGPLSLEELRPAFREYSNTTVFALRKLKHSFDGPYAPAERAALRRLAWDLPTRHARSYFAHRARLSVLLFGGDPEALPDTQVLMPGLYAYGDNPAVTPRRPAVHDAALDGLRALVDTPLFAGWIYLAAAFGTLVLALGRRATASRRLAGVVAASSLAYALPLALVSGSAEFRYLAWPLLAAMLALALAFAGTQKTAGA